jgi:hypothetical protein
MKQDFCLIFLEIFPCIKIYGNIKISLTNNNDTRADGETTNNETLSSIRVPLTSSNNVVQTQRDNRFYFSKEVNKKFLLENSNDAAKHQQLNKNLNNFVILDVPD